MRAPEPTLRELRFQSGGTLRSDAFYAERPADAELLSALLAGEFCYVLAPRQIGKSSLRLRTEQKLRERGVQCATIDLTRIGSRHVAVEEWYHSLADEIAERLSLSAALEEFWQRSQHGSPVHRFARFLRDVVLAKTQSQVVLFIDEIDAVLGLSFSMDDFFGVIRACFNDRADDPQFDRLTFCVLGAAAATDLIQDAARTPFNIGRSIRLDDLTEAEAAVFLPGLERLAGAESGSLLREVLRWTSGHPYMTQRVCEELTRRTDLPAGNNAERVARVVQETFLLRGRVEDQNLAYAEKRLRSEPAERIRRLLQQYRRLLDGETVLAEGEEPVQITLRLCGLAADRQQGKLLQVRNLIFATVFNRAWADTTQAALAPAFQAGGGLRPGALYVERPADQSLAEATAVGEFCAVLAPRLAGKTSLLYRTLMRLGEQGLRCAYVNVVELGLESAEEKWHRLLAAQLGRSLLPEMPTADILERLGAASPMEGWLRFFEDEVLPRVPGPIVIFFDEIDKALRFTFDVEFFGALTELHRRRDKDPGWKRVSLSIAGLLDEELLQRRTAAEFLALCKRIPLEDFSWKEAQSFVPGLRELGDDPHALLDAVYAWTGGQPYQTQRICMALLTQGPERGAHASDRVDKVVDELFLGRGQSSDMSLRLAAHLVEQHPRCDEVLATYRSVLTGKRPPADERDPLHVVLLRSGLLACRPSRAGAILAPHNRVYATALGEDWSPEADAFADSGQLRIAVGQVVAGYRLQRLMKDGDLGPSFEAVSEKTGARVAVHVLPQADPIALLRAERELNATARLHHPGLLDTIEVSRLDQRTLLLIRPYLVGITLEDHLTQRGLRTAEDALTIGKQLAAVLTAVHALGVRHRNVKPSKVMLLAVPGGQIQIKLMGLGLLPRHDQELVMPRNVHATQSISFQGTPQYMAPEQCIGKAAGPEADVYQLGLLLYEMLAGQPPFVSSSIVELIQMHTMQEVRPLHRLVPLVPQALSQLVQTMLAKGPADRPSMSTVADTLADFQTQRLWQSFGSLPLPLPHKAETPYTSTGGQMFEVPHMVMSRDRKSSVSLLLILVAVGLAALLFVLLR